MTNYQIADNFSLLAKLMDIHGENSFKSKSYASAAFTIEKLPVELAEVQPDKLFGIKGIGDAIGKKILEQLQTGSFKLLIEYLATTPPGILEMLTIKGLGPKKIATIWKDLEIETIGELLYACNENRLTLYKGFGEKTQQNIKTAIEFYLGNLGSYLYQQIEDYAITLDKLLKTTFGSQIFHITGEYNRQLEIIEKLEWVTNTPLSQLENFFTAINFLVVSNNEQHLLLKNKENITIGFYGCETAVIAQKLFATSCSSSFLENWKIQFDWNETIVFDNETAIFSEQNLPFIPAFAREDAEIIAQAKANQLPNFIQPSDINGIIHSHSRWSDGNNTLEEMAIAAQAQGLEYLVISDHSKTAFYAQGLPVEKVLAQQAAIDELNAKFIKQNPQKPFTIFKSIESDILWDGNLDYEPEILATFDLVIASVHANLKMNEEKAMLRLLKAIENPYTSILGHMTGRLLLSRNGYPVNHLKIIDACAANNVVIELNAHPRRLDIDWRWIKHALNKNVLISINPDAHSIEGFNDCKYGVLVAQKAGLTPTQNLSSYNLAQFTIFVDLQHKKR